MDVYTHVFFTSALVGGEWSASSPDRFTLGERAPNTHWMGDWSGPRAGMDDMEKWKLLPPLGHQLWPFVIQPVASRYNDCAIQALEDGRISFRVVAVKELRLELGRGRKLFVTKLMLSRFLSEQLSHGVITLAQRGDKNDRTR
jgi:hypothetical protein